ncbi:MAG: glycosyltransferase family 2 protein, partial [Xanthomonadales bacterium]|nr:glycosyltransferase family 2 protein [Xanthomonadales bacterium]
MASEPTAQLAVVVPVLDEAAIIRQLLLPLQPFRGNGLEVLVVDGGSGDGTVALATPLCDRLVTSPPGRARQMNAGWRQSTADMLWFVHADCGVGEHHVKAMMAASEAGANWGFFTIRLKSPRAAFRVIERGINIRSRLTRLGTGDQGLFVRRSMLEAAGGFADLPLMEDLALCKRLRRKSRPKVLSPPLETSTRRWEQGGIARTVILMWLLRGAWS